MKITQEDRGADIPVTSGKARAKAVMVAGTMSNAGKSFIAAGLCRIFTEDGYRVAPFKAQNMALNSFVTRDGREIGRSQAVQAEACRRKPDARMNPILLKPTTDKGSQVIILGQPVADMDAKEYYRHKNEYIPYIKEAYESLASENDIIVLEGAGSPAEINLKENDIVNMPMAEMADASVILVGNIDPGGVFAQLYGTVKLLDPAEQDRIKGLVINKFRGDLSILEPGLEMLEKLTGKPVLGVLPYMDVHLEPEDSLAMEEAPSIEEIPSLKAPPAMEDSTGIGNGCADYTAEEAGAWPSVDIAVIRFPKISNFTDFEALRREADVRLRYVSSAGELGTPDAVILPGTKSTVRDLIWLRENGLETGIRRAVDRGAFLVGICGGFQMLGTKISDPEGAELKGEVRGLGYLDMETVFSPEKILRQTETVSHFGIPELDGKKISGYEIHMGRNADEKYEEISGQARPFPSQMPYPSRQTDAIGTYLHGIFDEDEFREAFLSYLYERKGKKRHRPDEGPRLTYREYKEEQLSRLSAMMRKALDIPAIYRMMGLGNEPEPAGRKAAHYEDTGHRHA